MLASELGLRGEAIGAFVVGGDLIETVARSVILAVVLAACSRAHEMGADAAGSVDPCSDSRVVSRLETVVGCSTPIDVRDSGAGSTVTCGATGTPILLERTDDEGSWWELHVESIDARGGLVERTASGECGACITTFGGGISTGEPLEVSVTLPRERTLMLVLPNGPTHRVWTCSPVGPSEP